MPAPQLGCGPCVCSLVVSLEAMSYETFRVQRKDREPILNWMVEALEASGCRLLFVSEPNRAPFRLTFETAMGERLGIVAYAFLANSEKTRNRPADEHRFQIKYGSKDGRIHEIFEDPFRLYTTIFVGINLQQGFFVAADPAAHSPTRFFISLEFKQHEVDRALETGWASWERPRRGRVFSDNETTEVLVAGSKKNFLRLIRFERAASGLDPGHRQLLAEKFDDGSLFEASKLSGKNLSQMGISIPHSISQEFQLDQAEILDLIQSAPRLKMAVRGWVAEEHLLRELEKIPGVENCVRMETEGGADLQLRYRGSRKLEVECKNVLRKRLKDGTIKLDFQRTRASKNDPCSRYYSAGDFDIVAACLHSCTEKWEFRYVISGALDVHKKCAGKLDHRVQIDNRWTSSVEPVLAAAASKK